MQPTSPPPTDSEASSQATIGEKKRIPSIKFVHITKTGGTSIVEVGKSHGMMWGQYDTDIKNCRTLVEVSPAFWHIPIRLFEKNPYNQEHVLFTVVRNPYQRIVSECFCKWGGRFKKNKNKPFGTAEEFNDYITDRVSVCEDNDYFHFTPQYFYTHDADGRQVVDHILRFENLETEFNELMAHYGLNIPLNIQENSSIKSFSVADISRGNLDLINEKYFQDFTRFGYPFH
jgi:Sulfotransferase family